MYLSVGCLVVNFKPCSVVINGSEGREKETQSYTSNLKYVKKKLRERSPWCI